MHFFRIEVTRMPLARLLCVVVMAACSDPAAQSTADGPITVADARPDAGAADAAFDARPPEILQVLVTSDVATTDPLHDPEWGYALTFGFIADFDLCPTTGDCPATVDGVPLTCATTGVMSGHCVLASTGELPSATQVPPKDTSIRTIVSRLLDGKTLEQFACACQGSASSDLDPGRCNGPAWSIDPLDCSICGGDQQSRGRCLDQDNNLVPDVASFQRGIATIRCGAGVAPGAAAVPSCPAGWTGGANGTCVHMTVENEGYYNPSGNPFATGYMGLAGMGPAIDVRPTTPLPVRTECSIAISDAVKDRLGLSLSAPSDVPHFRTGDLALTVTSPRTELIDVSVEPTLSGLSFAANTIVDVSAAEITLTDTSTSAVVTATEVTTTDVGFDAEIPELTLVADHVYEITVKKVTDRFGLPLATDFKATFKAIAP